MNPIAEIKYCNITHTLDQKSTDQLTKDFDLAMRKLVAKFPEDMKDSYFIGYVIEQVVKSQNKKDCIYLPIEDKANKVGGREPVYGWKVVKVSILEKIRNALQI